MQKVLNSIALEKFRSEIFKPQRLLFEEAPAAQPAAPQTAEAQPAVATEEERKDFEQKHVVFENDWKEKAKNSDKHTKDFPAKIKKILDEARKLKREKLKDKVLKQDEITDFKTKLEELKTQAELQEKVDAKIKEISDSTDKFAKGKDVKAALKEAESTFNEAAKNLDQDLKDSPEIAQLLENKTRFLISVSKIIHHFDQINAPGGEFQNARNNAMEKHIKPLLAKLNNGEADESAIIAATRLAETEMVKGYLTDHFKDQAEILKAINALYTTYDSGDATKLTEKDQEAIKKIVDAIQGNPELAAIVNTKLEGGADAERYDTSNKSFEAYFKKMCEAAVQLKADPQFAANVFVQRNAALLEEMSQITTAENWKKFLEESKKNGEDIEAPTGPLNVLVAYQRIQNAGAKLQNVDQDIFIETRKEGANYRYAFVAEFTPGYLAGEVTDPAAAADTPPVAAGATTGAPTTTPDGTATAPPDGTPAAPDAAPPTPPEGAPSLAVTAEITPPPAEIQKIGTKETPSTDFKGGSHYQEAGKYFYVPFEQDPVEVDLETLNILRGINTPSEAYVKNIIIKHYSFIDPTLQFSAKSNDSDHPSIEITFSPKVGDTVITIDHKLLEKTTPPDNDITNFLNPSLTQEQAAELLRKGWKFDVTKLKDNKLAAPNAISEQNIRDFLKDDGTLKDPNTIQALAYYFSKLDKEKLGPNNIKISDEVIKKLLPHLDLSDKDQYAKVKNYLADKTLETILDKGLNPAPNVGFNDPTFDKFVAKYADTPEWQKGSEEWDPAFLSELVKSLIKQDKKIPTILLDRIDPDDLEEANGKFSDKTTTALKKALEDFTIEEITPFTSKHLTLIDTLWPEGKRNEMPIKIRIQYEISKPDNSDLNKILSSLKSGTETEFLLGFLAHYGESTVFAISEDNATEFLKPIEDKSPNAKRLVLENQKQPEESKDKIALYKAEYEKLDNPGIDELVRLQIVPYLESLDDVIKKEIAGSFEQFNTALAQKHLNIAWSLSRKGDDDALDAMDDLPETATTPQKTYYEIIILNDVFEADQEQVSALLKYVKEGHYSHQQLAKLGAAYLIPLGTAFFKDRVNFLIAAGLEGKAEEIIESEDWEDVANTKNLYLAQLSKNKDKVKDLLIEAYKTALNADGDLHEGADHDATLDIIEACKNAGITEVTIARGGASNKISIDDSPVIKEIANEKEGENPTAAAIRAMLIMAHYEADQCEQNNVEMCESGEFAAEVNQYLSAKDELDDKDYALAELTFKHHKAENLKTSEMKDAYVRNLYLLATREDAKPEHVKAFTELSEELLGALDALPSPKADVPGIKDKHAKLKAEQVLKSPDLNTKAGQDDYLFAVIDLDAPTGDQLKTAAKYVPGHEELHSLIGKTQDQNLQIAIYLTAYANKLKGNKDETLFKAYKLAVVVDSAVDRVPLDDLIAALLAAGEKDKAFKVMYFNNDYTYDDGIKFLQKHALTDLNTISLEETIEPFDDEASKISALEKLIASPNKEHLKNLPLMYRSRYFLLMTKEKPENVVNEMKTIFDIESTEKAQKNANHKFTIEGNQLKVRAIKEDGTIEDLQYTIQFPKYLTLEIPADVSGMASIKGAENTVAGSITVSDNVDGVDLEIPEKYRNLYKKDTSGSFLNLKAKLPLLKLINDGVVEITQKDETNPPEGPVTVTWQPADADGYQNGFTTLVNDKPRGNSLRKKTESDGTTKYEIYNGVDTWLEMGVLP